jgi:predicted nuclease with TOPRIM domain
MKELKIPVSCRILPDLKEDIEVEAQEAGLTTSLYLEQILQSRHEQAELDETLEAEAEELRAKVKSLQIAGEKVKHQLEEIREDGNRCYQELSQSKVENDRLKANIKQLEKEIQPLKTLGFTDLSLSELSELEGYFSALEKKYPSHSRSYILLATFNRMVKNENGMFVIHTIDGY